MLRIATVNVNGVRAAWRKGMSEWLDAANPDIVTLQEVRADTEELVKLIDASWHFAHDPCSAKGRAGVAVVSKIPFSDVRVGIGPEDLDSSGRWIETDLVSPSGTPLTIVSAYVHSGEAETAKQDAKYAFLEVMDARMKTLGKHSHALVTGDLNVGHRTLDIRNWKGNLKNAGFLPREREYFDNWLGREGEAGYNSGEHGRFVDVGRAWAGEVEGPYTWWSWRGKAFDNDAGWRIDYQLATPALAKSVRDYRIDRAPSYDTRWSDHAPVVADYEV